MYLTVFILILSISFRNHNVFLSANYLTYQTNVILRTVKQEC